eukprot:TRINITY_DN5463_c0_g1_i3.p1 TRINITY_DN5463_c0_g1~~TRINITY_DN5463_c0_g1_i3.p1  ORF type:complete len:533 (+),score=54.75 TRINITY_DN5463_c0_g1_i3:68-1666(+)
MSLAMRLTLHCGRQAVCFSLSQTRAGPSGPALAMMAFSACQSGKAGHDADPREASGGGGVSGPDARRKADACDVDIVTASGEVAMTLGIDRDTTVQALHDQVSKFLTLPEFHTIRLAVGEELDLDVDITTESVMKLLDASQATEVTVLVSPNPKHAFHTFKRVIVDLTENEDMTCEQMLSRVTGALSFLKQLYQDVGDWRLFLDMFDCGKDDLRQRDDRRLLQLALECADCFDLARDGSSSLSVLSLNLKIRSKHGTPEVRMFAMAALLRARTAGMPAFVKSDTVASSAARDLGYMRNGLSSAARQITRDFIAEFGRTITLEQLRSNLDLVFFRLQRGDATGVNDDYIALLLDLHTKVHRCIRAAADEDAAADAEGRQVPDEIHTVTAEGDGRREIKVLMFPRTGAWFHKALLEGSELQEERAELEAAGFSAKLTSGATIFVEPEIFTAVVQTIETAGWGMTTSHVIVSETMESRVLRALSTASRTQRGSCKVSADGLWVPRLSHIEERTFVHFPGDSADSSSASACRAHTI